MNREETALAERAIGALERIADALEQQAWTMTESAGPQGIERMMEAGMHFAERIGPEIGQRIRVELPVTPQPHFPKAPGD